MERAGGKRRDGDSGRYAEKQRRRVVDFIGSNGASERRLSGG